MRRRGLWIPVTCLLACAGSAAAQDKPAGPTPVPELQAAIWEYDTGG